MDTLEEDLNVKKTMCVVAGLLCALSISADQDVTVQARTPIELTLLHHVHSGFSRAGAPVWLRVAEDVVVDDRVVVRAGTIAECRLAASRGAQSLGHGGSLTLDPRSVPAVDGSLIPLEGRVQVSGRERSMVGSILSWGIAGFGAKGKSAVVSMGTRLTGHVAAESVVTLVTEPAPLPPEPAAPDPLALGATVKPARYRLWANRHKPLKPLVVTVESPSDDPLTEMGIAAVGDMVLPQEARFDSGIWVRVKKRPQWQLTFHAWDVLQYFPGRRQYETKEVRFSGRTKTGRPVTASVTIKVHFDDG